MLKPKEVSKQSSLLSAFLLLPLSLLYPFPSSIFCRVKQDLHLKPYDVVLIEHVLVSSAYVLLQSVSCCAVCFDDVPCVLMLCRVF
jgi:hypothetical protein